MDSSRSPSSLYHRDTSSRVTPKKSPTTESVQKRRREIYQSEKSAYWAILNASLAALVYYDLCYLKVIYNISSLLTYLEWFICALFIASACYDFFVHLWPHTFMKPIMVNPIEKRLLGITEDEFGFKIQEPLQESFEQVYNLPPFEIQNLFEEDEKVVKPQKKCREDLK